MQAPTSEVGLGVRGGYSRKSEFVEKTTYEYDKKLQIINASGVGTLANWEFYQGGKGASPVGQYNLQIVFSYLYNLT